VTIVAGFKCRGGVVLCADTQETTGEGPKKSVPKLRFESGPVPNVADRRMEKHDLAAAFCGAGHGPFIDKIIDRAWAAVRSAPDLYEACDAAEDAIKSTYEEFGRIYQQGQCPHAEILYGITLGGRSRLFSAYGPIVNEQEGYVSRGIGYYLADFLASRMYASHLTARQCVILAAYILFQAKEHVEGCGGDSHIAVLRDAESSGIVEMGLVNEITEFVKLSDYHTGQILMNMADFDSPADEVAQEVESLIQLLNHNRGFHINHLREHRDFMNSFRQDFWGKDFPETDEFGLLKSPPKPSDSQKSEGQP
jgi:hypothetical protein